MGAFYAGRANAAWTCLTAGVETVGRRSAKLAWMLLIDIDQLLAEFSKELDCFVFTRDHLQPVMTELVRAVDRALADSGDAIAVGETRHLRARFADRLSGVQPLLEEWARIRGSLDLLAELESTMSPQQGARFHSLLSRDATIAPGRDAFDSLQDHLRRQLLRFEETNG